MSQQMHVDKTFERRLRPIYDHIESNNNRKVIQDCDKLLKKHPNYAPARALKGLALMRIGRHVESNNLLQAVADEKPTEDSILQVLSFCYREMEQQEKIVEIYQHAVKKCPGNEELLAHLFISYVRVDDYKSQQSTALQLYKSTPKNAYYFWAVMSIVLQAVRGSESVLPDKRKLYLMLAQRMAGKFVEEKRLETDQEVFLYLHILMLQAKYAEAFEFLNSEIALQLFPSAPLILKFELMKKLCKWKELNSLLKQLLLEEPDRWDYYKEYLETCFELCKSMGNANNINTNDDGVNASLDECHDFLCQIIENVDKKKRGPYLARLELHRRMRENNYDADKLLGDFTDLIIDYFRLFGHKSCVTHDIGLFLHSTSLEKRLELAAKLKNECGVGCQNLPKSKEDMQKHICSLQLTRMCGANLLLSKEALKELFSTLKLYYEYGKSAFGENLLATDMGPSDPYALLAANVMYDLATKEQKSEHLFEALCLLQYVLRNSTSNFHVKLLSLKIYHFFGCLLGAQEMYDFLDVKQIQFDSIGYLHCNLLPLNGRFSVARSVLDSTLKFFTGSYRERLDIIAMTYRYCSFSKMEEFLDFREKLKNSLHFVLSTVEAQLCDLATLYGNVQQNISTYTAMNINPEEDSISWHDLSDNRDLGVVVRWDPLHLIDPQKEADESFNQEIEVLHVRSMLLRLFASLMDLFCLSVNNIEETAKNRGVVTESEMTNEMSTIELLCDTWQQLFKRLGQTELKPLTNRFLVNLLPTRLPLLLDVPYEKFFMDLAQLGLQFHTGMQNLQMQCKTVTDNVSNLILFCKTVIEESNESKDGLWRRRERQSKVAACLEILSFYALLLSVMNEKLRTAAKTKTKKKPNQENQTTQIISERERIQLLGELMHQLKRKLEVCQNLIHNWKAPTLPCDLNFVMANMSVKPETETTLFGDITSTFNESHELMVAELENLIKDKIRMICK